ANNGLSFTGVKLGLNFDAQGNCLYKRTKQEEAWKAPPATNPQSRRRPERRRLLQTSEGAACYKPTKQEAARKAPPAIHHTKNLFA
ncbi:MAG: hypothetical protein KBG76_02605, partial [Saprospiraceae bacterium]|nr:hypothetical protein [Saprospiraceae bacterium]